MIELRVVHESVVSLIMENWVSQSSYLCMGHLILVDFLISWQDLVWLAVGNSYFRDILDCCTYFSSYTISRSIKWQDFATKSSIFWYWYSHSLLLSIDLFVIFYFIWGILLICLLDGKMPMRHEHEWLRESMVPLCRSFCISSCALVHARVSHKRTKAYMIL